MPTKLEISDAIIAVAYSGGRDSAALLHATVAAAAPAGIAVAALHVHHGLNPQADEWLARCEAFCHQLASQGADVRLANTRITARPARGESVEAWARTERYAALRSMAREQGATIVLLAHHRRDQAETLLLQALRGAGPAGLAGMPGSIERDGITWARPWLARSRDEIDAYVMRHRIAFIDDDSNDDERLARNRMRRSVWPSLLAAFPAAEGSLANAAQWAQEAAACLAELASIDLATVVREGAFDLVAWRLLSRARRSNVLRAWLRARTGGTAPMALVMRLMVELGTDRPARWHLPTGELRSHRGMLVHVDAVAGKTLTAMSTSPEPELDTEPEPEAKAEPEPELKAKPQAKPEAKPTTARDEMTLHVNRAGTRRVPAWHGALKFERVAEGGVSIDRLRTLVIRSRQGQEHFQAGAARPPRALKKQFQSLGVSAWDRDGPLVYSGDLLLFVPGLGIDHRALAPAGTPQMTVHWIPGH